MFITLVTLGGLILCPILLCFSQNNPLKAVAWTMLILLIFSVFVAAWVIYGYVIYFSDSNDCQKSYDTSVALVFFCIFIILGLCCICQAVALSVATPIVFFGSIRPMLVDEDRKKDKKKFFKNLVMWCAPILITDDKKKKKSDSDNEENEGGDGEDHALIKRE